jgi:hypothetical protein
MTDKKARYGSGLALAPENGTIQMNTKLMPDEIAGQQAIADAIPYPAVLLLFIYLEAGLPPDAALRAAMADYEQFVQPWILNLVEP